MYFKLYLIYPLLLFNFSGWQLNVLQAERILRPFTLKFTGKSLWVKKGYIYLLDFQKRCPINYNCE